LNISFAVHDVADSLERFGTQSELGLNYIAKNAIQLRGDADLIGRGVIRDSARTHLNDALDFLDLRVSRMPLES
jgi:hypothetical protein